MITPYLCTRDTRAALGWYERALGAATTFDPMVMDDGRVGHAEMTVHGARVMLSDPYPELHVDAPSGGAPVTLCLEVLDCDATTDRARAAGAAVDREPGDGPPGRVAVVRDPFGHRWMLVGPNRETQA